MSAPKLSWVVIGKNEAENLAECLRSIANQHQQPDHEILYVDSGSTDGSLDIARRTPGVRVLALEDQNPNAAKARNLGWKKSSGEFVHFVDADSTLSPHWISRALAAMDDPLTAVVCGGLRERHPERSIYNRFADLDWPNGSGPTDTFGGIALVRREALERCGGYAEDLKSGEEPELAQRLIRGGYTVLQLPLFMAWHDLDMTTFQEYWRRNVMVGWAYSERAARIRASGRSALYERSTKSLLILLVVLGLVVAGCFEYGEYFLVLLALAFLDLGRLAYSNRDRAGSWSAALLYALHLRFVPLPFLVGSLRWRRDRKQRSAPTQPAGTVATQVVEAPR